MFNPFRQLLVPFFLLMIHPAFAQDVLEERPVGPGVTYSHLVKDGPLNIYVMKVDLTNEFIDFAAVPGKDDLITREQPSSIAARLEEMGKNVIGAINADFGNQGNSPVGMFVRDGRMLVTPSSRSSFALDSGKQAQIINFDFTLKLIPLEDGEEPITIDFLNRWYDYDEAALFGPAWKETPKQDNIITEVFLEVKGGPLAPNSTRDVLVRDALRSRGGNPIPDGFYALQLPSDSSHAERFGIGQQWTLSSSITPVIENLQLVVSGGPRIVKDGGVFIPREKENISEAFVNSKHPRTSIGISKDRKTLILAVVDGRQPGYSLGVSLQELAKIMIELGAGEALNMDGGGSSTMFVRGEVKNSPSDASGERATTSSFLVLSTDPGGPTIHLEIEPKLEKVIAQIPYIFKVRGYDPFWNEKDLSKTKIEWKAVSDGVVVVQEGTMVAMQPEMEGVLAARTETAAAAMPFTVVEPERWEVVPKDLALAVGDRVDLQINAYDSEGDLLFVPDDALLSSVSDGGANVIGKQVIARAAGRGTIDFSVGSHSFSVPYSISKPVPLAVEDFEESKEWGISSRSSIEAETTFTETKETTQEGYGAGRLTWAFEPGEISAAYITFDALLPESTRWLTMWVYGDNSNHLLRAELEDSKGDRFLLSLTNDINWGKEWRQLKADLSQALTHWGNPEAVAVPPFTLKNIYVVEPRLIPAGTRRGVLLIDNLEAITTPDEIAE